MILFVGLCAINFSAGTTETIFLAFICGINLMSDFLRASEKKNIKVNSQELVAQIKGQSKKEVENILASKKEELGIYKEVAKKEIIVESCNEVRLNITLKKSTMDKIKKLKALLAHSNPNLETSDLLDYVLDDAIKKVEAKKFAVKKARVKKESTTTIKSSSKAKIVTPSSSGATRYIPASIKREVYNKSNKSCTNCGSIFFLEYDHKKSFAKNGATAVNNLQILCSSCNKKKAIIEYDQLHMDQFLIQNNYTKSVK